MASQSAGTCNKTSFPGLLMTTFALPERPRGRRAKYPKVRTGCIACKKRHVKCDEAKPACNRCLKWSGVCSGYAPPRAKSPSPQEEPREKKKASTRPLLMRTDSASSHLTLPMPTLDERLSSCSPSPSTPPTPPLLNFSYHNMGSIIDQYDPIPTDAGILDAAFWTDTVPRLVRDNLAVRYANMAVHLLILSKQSGVPQQVSDQYSQALGYYGLAIRKMRDSYEANGGLRAAILCSMFFIIFEAINGDKDAAEAHLFSGQSMLNDLFALLPQESVMSASAGSLRKELKNLLHYLSLQMRIGGVNCWKGEVESFYSGYLEEYLSSLGGQDDLLGVCDPNLFLPEMCLQEEYLHC